MTNQVSFSVASGQFPKPPALSVVVWWGPEWVWTPDGGLQEAQAQARRARAPEPSRWLPPHTGDKAATLIHNGCYCSFPKYTAQKQQDQGPVTPEAGVQLEAWCRGFPKPEELEAEPARGHANPTVAK